MTILVTIPCLLTGGTEIQTLSLVRALRKAGHDVVVACYFEYAEPMVAAYRAAGAEVRLLSPDGRRAAGVRATVRHLWRGLRRAVHDVRPDVAHVQYMAPGALPIIILRALGVRRIVATAHTAGDIYSPRGLKMIRWLNDHVLSAFQCITERAERSFFGDSRLFEAGMPLRGHGNHFTIYNNVPAYIARRESPREWDGARGVTIGVVSRLERIKGMDLVVPAFAEVRREHPEVRLLVVGDGSLRGEMDRQASEAGVADWVTFAGRQPQQRLQEYYDSIDVLLMPSRSEGFGLTAVEGMSRGCVPVVADVGGLSEVVRDGVEGRLHAAGSAAALASVLGGLLAQPEELRRLSAAALDRAAVFSASAYASAVAALYASLETH